uniref:Uncharacterized protein n=1 Tax=Anguilla anguilla TaxID=7936 RepID=A0A0E9X7B4_ANGAN
MKYPCMSFSRVGKRVIQLNSCRIQLKKKSNSKASYRLHIMSLTVKSTTNHYSVKPSQADNDTNFRYFVHRSPLA